MIGVPPGLYHVVVDEAVEYRTTFGRDTIRLTLRLPRLDVRLVKHLLRDSNHAAWVWREALTSLPDRAEDLVGCEFTVDIAHIDGGPDVVKLISKRVT